MPPNQNISEVLPQSPLPPQPSQPPTTPPSNLYPIINIGQNEKPNRFYAIPLIGYLIKIIILLPVIIWLMILMIGEFFVSIINSFIVLMTGKYWKTAYNYNYNLLRLAIETHYFTFGLTDKYPSFSRAIQDNSSVDVIYPECPNRFFAFPLIGGFIRIVLLVPYGIYQYVITYAAYTGVVFSSLPVLFMGKYPESTYELARDSVRVSQAIFVYMMGLSDKYPSFHLSMNHKVIKIILIIIGTLLMLGSSFNR